MIKVWDRQPVIELWNQGVSASRIIERLDLDVTVRQVQRIGARYGNRKARMSGSLGRAEWGSSFKDIVIQLMIQRGDNPYKCALCDKVSEKRMTVHHTKYEGATLADLVFACMRCQLQFENRGLT